MEKKRNPKLEIETNIPVVVTIGKMFYKGSNEYGEFFGYNLTYEGSEYTFFASPFVHERFSSFGQGATLNVVKRQKAGEKNVSWEISEVNGTPSGAKAALETIYDRAKPFDRPAYRATRIGRMVEALTDAREASRTLDGSEFSWEDIRSMAISFVIEEQRQGIPLDEPEAKSGANFNIPVILEEIKTEITSYIPGTGEQDKVAKGDLLQRAFGTHVWQEVTQQSGEALVEGLAKLRAAIVEDEDVPF